MDADDNAVLKLLLLISCVHPSSADTHTLQYLYTTVTPGLTDFPEFTAVGLLDGEQFMSYSSNNRSLIIKDSIKKTNSETYWRRETQDMWGNQHIFTNTFTTAMKKFHHSNGVHTLQRMFGCERDDDDDVTTGGYDQYGYDGEDFISLNLTTGTWTAVKPQAVTIKHTWESKGSNKHWKNFLERECIDLLKTYTSNSRDTLNRKVRPEVSVFQKRSPSPEVVCHATGFFPKPLNITWQKDGEDEHEGVELRETLPNQDGSFQKRIILKVSRMKLWIHNYTCVVQHSSLEKELVREVPKGGGSGGRSDGALIAIITAVVAALLAVVVGIVVWKKKNSAHEGDSSFNNSKTVSVYRPAELRERHEEGEMRTEFTEDHT
ncbi:BOLA class I histocompatibility antigen, alpha chain BL3-7-like isoform X1 [Clarias gariepinus]|uniref:BOLA class I histocompatibility antigen, alpha chain BL3-7-like isoform X1 n=1 Tax=Clarias gariepinus TaxID=13013 RepID=UPI00234C498E|nr:BOLA class I histocompatibility antigen, alpha chain BL3-7-like isoform X1 [Clarias gariepinus]XP_053337124.1 BOLA class I histocompatibility antigen, alpha chain BL3-7-like isoform X1 [Clarias gariepinus]